MTAIGEILTRNGFEIKRRTFNFTIWCGMMDDREVWMEEDEEKGIIDGIGALGGMQLKTVEEINEALKVLHIEKELY